MLHTAVLQGLSDTNGERMLWRLDTDTPRRAPVLVLTTRRPSWERGRLAILRRAASPRPWLRTTVRADRLRTRVRILPPRQPGQ
ncbi:type I-E CRISPR-associated protein Cas6/Cse3/CasE [Amycolatopsis taiwanensis]|uniref:type I-E CRISPR-associated protein Cas6/Cse3/CasE n=1 Tax=Amycolatopsis taiwanensis TaxID=342230 RepID=UPI000A01744B